MKLVDVQFHLARIASLMETALLALSGTILCFLSASVFFEVLIRYVIHAPSAWTEEVAQFLLVWYGLLAAAVGAHKGLHFSLRFGVMHFNPRTRFAIRQGINVGIIAFLAVILKHGIDYLDIVGNQTSMGAEINMSIPYAGIPVGVGAILIIYVLDVADAGLSFFTGRQFSKREAREEEIYRSLRGEVAPPVSLPSSSSTDR
jgi:TRAP-type C4-dicarboxylate transport system permease small subunit